MNEKVAECPARVLGILAGALLLSAAFMVSRDYPAAWSVDLWREFLRSRYGSPAAGLGGEIAYSTVFTGILLGLTQTGLVWFRLSAEMIGFRRPTSSTVGKMLAAAIAGFAMALLGAWIGRQGVSSLRSGWPMSLRIIPLYSLREFWADPADIFYLAYEPTLTLLAVELFFRGLLQTALGREMPRSGAVLITAIIYTFVHFSFAYQADSGLYYYSWLFAGSLLCGILREWDGTIWSPWAAHAVYDFLVSGFSILIAFSSRR